MQIGDKVRLTVDLWQFPSRPEKHSGERLYSKGDVLTVLPNEGKYKVWDYWLQGHNGNVGVRANEIEPVEEVPADESR